MTTKEALERSKQQLRNLSDIPGMDEKEVQRLMAMPSATFIRKKKPVKYSQLKPTPLEKDKEL